MNNREIRALREAIEEWGGWGLFNPKTTDKLAAMGYFERKKHPSYDEHWFITDAGREALKTAQGEQK